MNANRAALNYWQMNGYTAAGIQAVCREIDNDYLAARVDFRGDGSLHVTMSQKVDRLRQGHLPATTRFIRDLVTEFGCGHLRGSVILWLEDTMWGGNSPLARRAPILAFSRHTWDFQTLLMPNPDFLDSVAYRQEKREIAEFESTITWEEKRPVAFWRGTATGCGIEGPGWQLVPRIRFALAAKEINDPSKLDAAITKILDYDDPQVAQRLRDSGIVGEYAPFLSFLRYRYLVDIDGFTCAWKSLFLKLASRSVTLKVESDTQQWFYDELIPWVHYVPIRTDLLDLPWVLEWLPAHDAGCRQIVQRANQLVDSLTYERAGRESAELLTGILECQRPE